MLSTLGMVLQTFNKNGTFLPYHPRYKMIICSEMR